MKTMIVRATTLILILLAWLMTGCDNGGDSTEDSDASTASPKIQGVTPSDGETGVAVTTKVWVEFSKEMDDASTEEAFALEADGTLVSGTFTWADNNMVFSPEAKLEQSTEYTVTIGTGSLDTVGNSLEQAHTSTFTTGSDVGVVSITPEDGDVEVPINSNIVVTFAQAMDEPAVESNFSLKTDAGDVAGTFSWLDNAITFKPDTTLLNANVFVASIGRGATDAEGNHLPDVFSATFTTIATAPEVSGEIISATPTWTWTAPADCTGFRYQLDGEDGDWTEVDATTLSYTVDTALTDGEHVLYVQAQYNDGDWSQSGSWMTEAGAVCEGDLVIDSADDLTGVDCLLVTGDLNVWGTTLTDLTGLESIRRVNGTVDLQYNGSLTSLTGLEGLVQIGGSLSAWGNNVLTSMDGLSNLETIEGSLGLNDSSFTSLTGLGELRWIGGNLSLNRGSTSGLDGLDSLTSIGGDLYIGRIANLADFTGLEQVESIGGTIHMFRSSLDSFTGLTSLTSIDGNLQIEESDVDSFGGLDNLDNIQGDLSFYDAYVTPDMTGLDGLTTIGGNLQILNSSAPASFSGLTNLLSIEGDLDIRLAGGLLDLDMPALQSIGGNLSVQDSHYLANFDGLTGLVSIGGNLTVTANMGVATVSGMTSLEAVGGDVSIQGNMILPTCDANNLEDQLLDHSWTGTANIAGNNDAGTCD